jgi:hypothetical protein
MRRYLVRAPMIVLFISLLIPVALVLSEEAGVTVGDFQWNGDIELGYRFTDIDGNEDSYKQYVNLQDGLKLFDLNLLARRNEGTSGPVDLFRFNLTGIGDPFPSGLLEVKKKKTYDFLASYRQFKYFTAPENLGLFSNNFSFDSTIGRGVLQLSVFPREDIKLNFGYNLVARTGDALVPRPFFPVEQQDLNERLNEFYISGNFPIGNVDFFIKGDYWNFKNKDEIDGPYPSSIQSSGAQACIQCHGVRHFAPTACTLCHTPGSAAGLPTSHQSTGGSEKRDESTGTFVGTIKAHTRLGELWDLDGAFIYAHSSGDADLSTTSGFVLPGSAESTANTYIGELGVSYLILKDLIFHADFRYHNIDQDGETDTDAILGAPARSKSSFEQTAYTGTFQLEYIPLENLTLRGGYQIQYQDVTAEPVQYGPFTGGKKPSDTTSWNQGWVASVDWKPYKFLTVFGEYGGANISDPYTWISPENQAVGKLKIKYDTPIKNLGLKGSALWTRRTNPQQDYTRDVQDYTATATYQPIEPLTMDFSYTYERIKDGKDIVASADPFIIVPNPSVLVAKVNFNSNAYIYSGGLSWDIYQGLGASFRGSYAKTTENNPQSYGDWVVSGWYKNKYVTPIVSLERTRLIDDINQNNNFDAYLLTLSLRKEF